MTIRILIGLCLVLSCFAESGSAKQIALSKSGKVVELSGLIIAADSSSINLINKNEVKGVTILKDANFPFPEALQKKLMPWIGKTNITIESLLAIKKEILSTYPQAQQGLISVEIPEQDVTSGVVTMIVTKAKVGDVKYSGNRWLSQERVAKKVPLKKGEILDEDCLLNDVSWLNQNPFHYTQVVLSPGSKKGFTDLELITKDRLPLRVYAGADNTGVESTGTARFYEGITWGNAFFIDDFFNYQFTCNSSFDQYNSHSLNYTSYLPWQHIFMLSGGYARIEPKIENFHHHSKEAQASVRYKIPFKPLYTKFQHQLYFGFDYKYMTSILFFVSEVAPTALVGNTIVNVTQAMVGYLLEYKSTQHELTFRFDLFGSPVEWLPHQNSKSYSAMREDAKPRYIYGAATFGDVCKFSAGYAIAGLIRAQATPNTLIPSEQFKLGGYNTVRGYEESVFISDNGVIGNFEIRSRPFSFSKRIKDELTLLVFMDYGWGYNYHPFDGIKTVGILWGAGPGLRYTINPYLNFRLDYGVRLHKIPFDEHSFGMLHVGGTLSY